MGGQSAFGTKAGDLFTWITYGTAVVWVLMALLTIKVFTNPPAERAAAKAAKQGGKSSSTPLVPPGPLSTETGDTITPSDAKIGGTGKTDEKSAPPVKEEGKEKTPATESEPKAKTEEPASKEAPKVEEPAKTEEPKVEQPKAEAPKPEAPAPTDPPADETSTDKPATEAAPTGDKVEAPAEDAK
jgi:preprotein translocase subunit SecG